MRVKMLKLLLQVQRLVEFYYVMNLGLVFFSDCCSTTAKEAAANVCLDGG